MRTILAASILLVLIPVTSSASWAQVEEAESIDQPDVPDLPDVGVDPSGFIYGVVETRGAAYEGRIQWKRRDAFWSDFIESTKEDRPFWKVVPVEERTTVKEIEILGRKMKKRAIRRGSRGLMIRYGDVERIEVHNRSWSTLVLRDGTEIETSGGRDLRANLAVHQADGTQVDLEWRRVLRIRFLPTPADLSVDAYRMFGTVKTRGGELTGFIQWDKEECLSTDILDGHARDGERDMEIPMGEIVSIERIDRESSRFVLKDGRELELYGTNDVDHENRGIWVEVPEWGRIAVSWRAFERVDFQTVDHTGPSYEDFDGASPLVGTVRTTDGGNHAGRIVFDIDEAASWELLNGEDSYMEYDIPFALIRSVERLSDEASRVTVTSGATVDLRDSMDVAEGNSGVLVLDSAGTPQYFPWSDVAKIDFGAPPLPDTSSP